MKTLQKPLFALSLISVVAIGVSGAYAQDAANSAPAKSPGTARAQYESLLTPEERAQFRDKMRDAKSREERLEIQRQMRGTMEQRAKEKGIALPQRRGGDTQAGPRGPQGRPGFDGRTQQGESRPSPRPQLFTTEERAQYRDKLRAAKSPEERQSIRNEMRAETEKRAKEKGVTLPQRPRRDAPGRPQNPA